MPSIHRAAHRSNAPPAALDSAERPLLARLHLALNACCSSACALPLDSFWEARGHAGSVCHALRGMMRSLLFATHVTPGRDTPAVYAVQRYCNAFFALMLQDVRMAQELREIPSALLTESEKHELVSVRRRPLMVLGWIQLTLRDIKRRVEVDMVQSNKFEETMDVLSVGYHGCCKIVSQPLPFAYEQLTLTLTLALALTLTRPLTLTLTLTRALTLALALACAMPSKAQKVTA